MDDGRNAALQGRSAMAGMRGSDAAARGRTPSFVLAAALALAAACLALLLLPGRAWAYGIEFFDVNGNPIVSGSTIDVNVLQQGITYRVTKDEADPDIGRAVGLSVRNGAGQLIATLSGDTWVESSTVRGGSLVFTTSLAPGEQVTLVGVFNEILENGQGGPGVIYRTEVSITVSGGQDPGTGDEQEGEIVPPAAEEPADGDGADPAGDPSGSGDQNTEAGTDTPAESQEGSSESEASSERASVGEEASESAAPVGAQSSASTESADEGVSSASAGAQDVGFGSDDATQVAESGSAAAVSGEELSGMGAIYGLGGSAEGSASGDADGSASSPIALAVTGIPWLWAVLAVAFALALPSGAASRLGARLASVRRASRLA